MARKKNKAPKKHFLFEEVFKFLSQNSGKSFNYKQIASALDLDASEKFNVIEVLDALCLEKHIVETDRGKYSVKSERKTYEGVIDFTSSGDAYV
ncbi:MAG: ribonuclease R, partial [Bacteroidota bacterium]